MIPFIVLASILTSSFLNIVLIWMLPLSPATPCFFYSLSVSYRCVIYNFLGTDSQVRMDTMKSLPKPVGGHFCCVSSSVRVSEVKERPCPAGARLTLEPFSLFLTPFFLLTIECLVLQIWRSVCCNYTGRILYTPMVFTSALSHGCFNIVSGSYCRGLLHCGHVHPFL